MHNKLHKRCDVDLELKWIREISHTPIVGHPIIYDIDADGKQDVIISSFTDVVTVLSGSDGNIMYNSKWPIHIADVSFHSSPLIYDIDGDGMDDIVLITTNGEMLFYRYNGVQLSFTSFLPPLKVKEDWLLNVISADESDIHDYIFEDELNSPNQSIIFLKPHVLSTPIICDLNLDGNIEEMVIPVSYYLNMNDNDFEKPNQEFNIDNTTVMDKFVAGSLVIYNLTSLEIMRTIHLELTGSDSEYPGYVIYSPTIGKISSDVNLQQIFIGTSTGKIHVLDMMGNKYEGFPIIRDAIQGRLAVSDIDFDGDVEIIAMDVMAILVCYSDKGELVWDTQLSGNGTDGFRLLDINKDNILDIVLATNDGSIWVVNGKNGQIMDGWPNKIGRHLYAMPLVFDLSNKFEGYEVASMSDDSHLHIINLFDSCRYAINIGETSFASVLLQDLLPDSDGLEILISSTDGTILCLGGSENYFSKISEYSNKMYGLAGETRSYNDFTLGDTLSGIVINRFDNDVMDITGGWMKLYFEIIDNRPVKRLSSYAYNISAYFGKHLITNRMEYSPGVYTLAIPVPNKPKSGHLKLQMMIEHGIIFHDTIAVRFNTLFLHDLQWLLLWPFIAMGVIVLFHHGYPAVDLLPMTTRSKKR